MQFYQWIELVALNQSRTHVIGAITLCSMILRVLALCPGGAAGELLLQGVRFTSALCAQTQCEGHGLAPADCFASAGETQPAPGKQAACQLLPQRRQPDGLR